MDWAEPTGLDWAYSSPIRSSPLSGVVPPTSNSPKKNTAEERAHVRRSQPHSAFAASVDSMLATTEHYVARLAHEPSVGLYYIQEHVHRSVRALERERETLKNSSENARDGAEVATQAREHLDEHLQTLATSRARLVEYWEACLRRGAFRAGRRAHRERRRRRN
ncbi:hypothetical protein PPROV_001033100 [Pycnococcus provasolii]|uniref:Uncharacterized protein n=1 Tax=Pycnococcus provasolii TaxID=41880 RepID=A0A830HXX9_9CHLO|nr:hypothetical protein PPROV_001033100 [Pycnococcus provasolii]